MPRSSRSSTASASAFPTTGLSVFRPRGVSTGSVGSKACVDRGRGLGRDRARQQRGRRTGGRAGRRWSRGCRAGPSGPARRRRRSRRPGRAEPVTRVGLSCSSRDQLVPQQLARVLAIGEDHLLEQRRRVKLLPGAVVRRARSPTIVRPERVRSERAVRSSPMIRVEALERLLAGWTASSCRWSSST